MVCVSQELQDEERKALADILLALAEIRGSVISFLHAKRNSKQIRDGATLVMVVALKVLCQFTEEFLQLQ
jgi:hypothetical protein